MINILFLILAFYLLWKTNLRTSVSTLTSSPTALHLFLASTLGITLLAFLKAGTLLTMPLHFLGLACTTLILGKRLMLLACTISAFALVVSQKITLEEVGLFLISSLMIPILFFEFFREKVSAKINKPWQFLIVVVGIGSVISLIVKTLINSVYYYTFDNISLTHIIDNYLLLSLLFWIPEIMLNSTIIMTLMQHKPHWISNYNRSRSHT